MMCRPMAKDRKLRQRSVYVGNWCIIKLISPLFLIIELNINYIIKVIYAELKNYLERVVFSKVTHYRIIRNNSNFTPDTMID